MLDFIPISLMLFFVSITLLTLGLFYWILKKSTLEETRKSALKICSGLAIWLGIQLMLTLSNVYNSSLDAIPPRIFLFGIFPILVFILGLFLSRKGREFINHLPLKQITYLNIIRIPVELCLFFLFVHKAIPEIMTFAGRNFDILAGLTAPIIALICFRKELIRPKLLLLWNIISLLLLFTIIVTATLSTPSPLQQFGYEQPNIGILNFPFSWLPTFIVPVVLFGHFVSIWKLILGKNS